MNSTITKKTRPLKRKPQSRKRPASPRRVAKKSVPAPGIADWIGLGVGSEGLPEWKDLSSGKKANRRKKVRNVKKQVDSFFSEVSTSQFALVVLAAVLGLGFYVSHVFATRDTLSILEQQTRDNLRLELQYNQLKGQLDKKISPNVIYRRAKELGLEEGLAFGPTIEWQLESK